MAITNGYTTEAAWTARYWKGTGSPTSATVEQIIEAVSREIDNHCRRVFYTTGSAPSSYATKYFTAAHHGMVRVMDLITLSSIALDTSADYSYATTLTTADYVLMPGLDDWPTTWIEPAPVSAYWFPTHSKGIKIAGVWGFAAAIPKPVVEACLIQSNRVYSRIQNAYGTVGGGEGVPAITIAKLDPDVEALLTPYVKAQAR